MSLVLQNYVEDKHFHAPKQTVPKRYSQRVVLRTTQEAWHVVVTLIMPIEQYEAEERQSTRRITEDKRQKDLKELTQIIDLGKLPLLRDTVTEVLIMDPNEQSEEVNIIEGSFQCPWKSAESFSEDNSLANLVDGLIIRIREDPGRIRYPILGNARPKVISPESVQIVEDITIYVSRVKILASGQDSAKTFVYKKVKHVDSRDSAAMMREIEILEQCHATPGIVRMEAIVAGVNPYMTACRNETEELLYVRGILLEDHGEDTLGDALKNSSRFSSKWRRWMLTLAEALSGLHALGFCHLDLHEDNVIIGDDGDRLILIDISCGYDGWYPDGAPPEIRRQVEDQGIPLKRQPLDIRQSSDVWALGMLLSRFVEFEMSNVEREYLQDIVDRATQGQPRRRLTLSEITRHVRGMIELAS